MFEIDRRFIYILLGCLVLFSIFTYSTGNIVSLLFTIPPVIIAITFHEFAHAWMADKLGDETPRMQGRLTLNPLSHLDPVGFVLLMFAGFGWGKPVQIDTRNFNRNVSVQKGEVLVSLAGPVMNFILAIVILFIYTLIWGGGAITPKVLNVVEDKPAAAAGLKSGDVITNINGYNVSSWDKAQIILFYKNTNEYYTFEVKHTDGTKEEIKIKPEIIKDEETGAESKLFGIQIDAEDTSNVFKSFVYSIRKFNSIISSMVYTIWGLISGKIGLSALSGPVGIYEAVGETINYGINYFLYILAFLSINVGFINILPFPAFDGGHVLFLIIEKIKGSPVNAKIENTCHLIGFILVFLLMIVVTISDIIKLF